MKAAFIALAFISINHIKSAEACDLDDCDLPLAQHLESARFIQIPGDDWAWMNHDLALARSYVEDGDLESARRVVAGLDYAMRIRADMLVESRGRSRVMAFHRALDRIQIQADGQPLATLELAPRSGLTVSGGGHGVAFGASDQDDDDAGQTEEDPAASARRDAEARRRDEERPNERTVPQREPSDSPIPR